MKQMQTKDLVYIALSICLLTVGSYIKIPIWIVPFSLQFFMVVCITLIMPRFVSISAITLYIALGLLGFPVFANGGGIAYITQPTFGFLLGFLSFPIIFHATKQKYPKLAIIFSWVVLYIIALTYAYTIALPTLHLSLTPVTFLSTFFLPFAPVDLILMFVAFNIQKRLYPFLSNGGFK